MTIEQHVHKTFDEMINGDFDSALMNVCIGIDGTCKKYFKKVLSSRSDYKQFI